MFDRKLYDKIRYQNKKTPDKPCIRCGEDVLATLKVVNITKRKNKTVLCANCRENLREENPARISAN